MGGTAGDLVTATIDGKDTQLDEKKLLIHPNRSKLKKPHLFHNASETTDYIQSMTNVYNSLPSHCLDFHIEQQHDFISIIVEDIETARWAATRFKELHLPHVWEEVMNYSNISTVEEYAELMIKYSQIVKEHTNKIIYLHDILEGNLLSELNRLGIEVSNHTLYEQWLSRS